MIFDKNIKLFNINYSSFTDNNEFIAIFFKIPVTFVNTSRSWIFEWYKQRGILAPNQNHELQKTSISLLRFGPIQWSDSAFKYSGYVLWRSVIHIYYAYLCLLIGVKKVCLLTNDLFWSLSAKERYTTKLIQTKKYISLVWSEHEDPLIINTYGPNQRVIIYFTFNCSWLFDFY